MAVFLPSILFQDFPQAPNRQRVRAAPLVSVHARRPQHRVQDRLFRRLNGRLKQRLQPEILHPRRGVALRRERDHEIPASMPARRPGTRQSEARPPCNPLELPRIRRSIRRHHHHDRPVGEIEVFLPFQQRPAALGLELFAYRYAIHDQNSAEIRLHENADRVAALFLRQKPRARPNSTFEPEHRRPGTGAYRAFLDRPSLRFPNRRQKIFLLQVLPPNIVQPSIIRLANNWVHRTHILIPGQIECVALQPAFPI